MELLIGILLGLVTLIPGIGVGVAIAIASYIPMDVGLYALISGMIFNSIMEAIDPISSGGYGTMFDYTFKVNKGRLARLLIKYKTIFLIISILIGKLLPPIIGGNGLLLTYLITIFIIRRNLLISTIWLLISSLVMNLCIVLEITQPIIVISTTLFVIPILFTDLQDQESNNDITNSNLRPNILTIWVSSILSIMSPGVSPQALTTNLFPKQGIFSSFISTVLVEVVIEGLALGQASNDNNLGKALVSNLVILPRIDLQLFIYILLVMGFALCLVRPVLTIYNISISSIQYISAIVSVAMLVILTGWWSILFLLISLLTYMFIGHKVDSDIKGLTFLSLILS